MGVQIAAPFQWYEQRPMRERIMLLACVIVVLLFLVNLLLLQPLQGKSKQIQLKISDITTELTQLKILEQEVLARKGKDPNSDNKKLLQVLQGKTISLEQQLEDGIVNLVPPREMPGLLKELLTQQDGLTLLSLENMVPEQVHFSQLNDNERGVLPLLYRHSLRLTFNGDYLTLLQYLKQLEQLPRTIIWEEVDIETEEYPRTTVRLQVYTLSLLEGWIGG